MTSGERYWQAWIELFIEFLSVSAMALGASQSDWAALNAVLATPAFHDVREVVFVAHERSPPGDLCDAAVS